MPELARMTKKDTSAARRGKEIEDIHRTFEKWKKKDMQPASEVNGGKTAFQEDTSEARERKAIAQVISRKSKIIGNRRRMLGGEEM